MHRAEPTGIDGWIGELRAAFAEGAADLLPTFETYAAEAAFGRRFIAADIEALPAGAGVLEVGAGSMILSCQLAREGFAVTALEPTGSGFGHFERMRSLVLQVAAERGRTPQVLDGTAESLAITGDFDYAFSINVMEHVDDVEQALRRVAASLRPGASYRFTCPNYLFPYEPHFNIPTLFSKPLTERMFGRRIFAQGAIPDPAGLWRSLNWINVPGLRHSARQIGGLRMHFNQQLLVATLERIGTDPEFASRRSPLARSVILWLVRSGLHRAMGWVPAALQPVIDCRVQRVPAGGH